MGGDDSMQRLKSTHLRSIKLFLLLLLMAVVINSAKADSGSPLTVFFGPDNVIQLDLAQTFNADKERALSITATFPQSSWFGIGFGPRMVQGELVMMLSTAAEG